VAPEAFPPSAASLSYGEATGATTRNRLPAVVRPLRGIVDPVRDPRSPMGSEPLPTRVQPIPGIPDAGSIRLQGRLTRGEVPRERDGLLAAVRSASTPKVVLELGAISEIDTAGAALLVEAFLAGERSGKRVLFCSPSASVLSVFRLAGFADILDHCCPTPAETRRRLMAP